MIASGSQKEPVARFLLKKTWWLAV